MSADTVPRVTKYRLIDLFAGCGAMTRGFVDSGRFEPIFAVESEPRAAANYGANFPQAELVSKPIQQVEEFPNADVVIGGPPCQGFSTLNRQGGSLGGFDWLDFRFAPRDLRGAPRQAGEKNLGADAERAAEANERVGPRRIPGPLHG